VELQLHGIMYYVVSVDNGHMNVACQAVSNI